MTVLVTRITPSMKKREGYIASPLEDTVECTDLTFNTFDVYIFNKCIKVKDPGFDKWLCYWESTGEAMLCDVITQKLCTGYVRCTVLSKKEVKLESYPHIDQKKNVQYMYITGTGKLLNEKEAANETINTVIKSNEMVKCNTPAPKKVKGKSMSDYTPEEIAEYKKRIFG